MKDYFKDFDRWNRKKKEIHALHNGPYFYEGEIWWCSLGVNIDVEMDGKNDLYERPVLIIKKINLQSAWVVPITSTGRENAYVYPLITMPYYASIS